MTILQAIVMAVLQGVTELFPVSSLGHAVILPRLLHWGLDQKAADFIGIGRTRLLALLKERRVKAKVDKGRRYFVTASLVEYLTTLADA